VTHWTITPRHLSRRTRTLVAVALVLVAGVVIALVAFGSIGHGPDKAACKAAMQRQFDYGMQHPDAPAGARPAECSGVSDHDVQRFATEIIRDYVRKGSP
jgi:hypothetical protein